MNPTTYRRGGAGSEIGYTTVRCPLGWLLVAATSKGVCAVKLGDNATDLEADLRREFSAAELRRDAIVPAAWVRSVVAQIDGRSPDRALPIDVQGTAFQWRVWRALQSIPAGETRSYSEVARAIGRPLATRAVARACATNPVCLVIPCHRVVAKDGGTGGYRWGEVRKRRLLDRESAARAQSKAKAQKAK